MRLTLLALSLGIVARCAAQYPGALDTNFLPTDQGFGKGDGCNDDVMACALQPDGKVLIGGTFWTHNDMSRYRISRLNVDGTIDTTFTPNAPTGITVTRIVVQPDGKILMAGYSTGGGLIRLNSDGTVDATFNIGTGFTDTWASYLYAVALQPDGKILVGGTFTGFNGTPVTNLARINANGTFDPTFLGGGSGLNGAVADIVVQPDGKIVLGGTFTNCWGACSRTARLNANGTVDVSFQWLPGANGSVLDIDLRADGSFLVCGGFSDMHSTFNTYRVAKLLANGAVDSSFDQAAVVGGVVSAITEQPDGNILLGGGWAAPFLYRVTSTGAVDPTFTTTAFPPQYSEDISDMLVRPDGRIFIIGPDTRLGIRPFHRYTQLDADGTWDPTFGPGNAFSSGAHRMCRQPDGKTIVTGAFTSYFDRWTGGIVRLNVDGSLDTTFNAEWDRGQINQMILQPDGRILVAGYLDEGVARLNNDGSPDSSFNAGMGNDWIEDMVLQPDGKVIITGGFTQFNGLPLSGIARLNEDGSVDGTFNVGTGLTLSGYSGMVLALQPDGRVIVGGTFFAYNGVSVGRFCRVMPTGALDTTFQTGTGFDSDVRALTLVPDGRVFVAGSFWHYDGVAVPHGLLLHADGSVDSTFNAPDVIYTNPRILARYDPIGKLLVRTSTYSEPEAAGGIARLNLNGSLDPTFETGVGFGPNGSPYDVEIEADSSYTMVGYFTNYDGVGRNRIARIKGGISPKVAVDLRVLLGGPYGGFWMSWDLQTQGLLPVSEPYTALGYTHVGGGGGETIAGGTIPSGMIDWIVVELREAVDPSIVVATQSALVMYDGEVFAARLYGSLVFDVPHGDYYVAVRHRNHLGVMTAAPMPLTDVPEIIDLTSPSTPTYGIEAQKLVGMRTVLWDGDVNGDGKLKYVGSNNDRDPILVAIGGLDPNNTITGYRVEDVNMDGVVKYVGPDNDRDLILQNVGPLIYSVRLGQFP